MASCFDYYQAFPNPSGITWPFFDFEDKKLQYDVTNHLPDRQNMEFAPGNGLAVSDSCEAIAAQAINLSNAGDDALLYLYESTMESLALQEIINPIMISNGQEAATDICGPSLGVDYGERVVFPVPKSTGREEIMGCNANNLVSHTRDDGSGMEVPLGKNNTACGKRKNRKTDPYVSENVFDTNVLVPLKKSKKDSCESGASKDHEEKSNTELDVVRRDPPELLSNVVTKETKADSPKDYIHVRARRGQATDRHSLAERVRRQKISDRMNILQNLIPGCNKVTNKALLLEEIINYVQSLQIQVEILSMKLASTSYLRAFDDQITGHPFKELLPAEATTGPMIASGIAPHSVDHTRTVAQHRAPGTFG